MIAERPHRAAARLGRALREAADRRSARQHCPRHTARGTLPACQRPIKMAQVARVALPGLAASSENIRPRARRNAAVWAASGGRPILRFLRALEADGGRGRGLRKHLVQSRRQAPGPWRRGRNQPPCSLNKADRGRSRVPARATLHAPASRPSHGAARRSRKAFSKLKGQEDRATCPVSRAAGVARCGVNLPG